MTNAGKLLRRIITIVRREAVDNFSLIFFRLTNDEITTLKSEVDSEFKKRGLEPTPEPVAPVVPDTTLSDKVEELSKANEELQAQLDEVKSKLEELTKS